MAHWISASKADAISVNKITIMGQSHFICVMKGAQAKMVEIEDFFSSDFL